MKLSRLITVALAVAGWNDVAEAVANYSTGSPRCPCANVANVTNNASGINVVISDNVYAYPFDYGSTYCSAHDAGLSPFCGKVHLSCPTRAPCRMPRISSLTPLGLPRR